MSDLNTNDTNFINKNSEVNGSNVCPNCGSTDISYNEKEGLLICNYCRTKFENVKAKTYEMSEIKDVYGEMVGKGTKNVNDSKNLITLKCDNCGSEVIVDTSENVQARCHWCRNTLSINQKVPNGAVPDMILPFKVQKQDALISMRGYLRNYKYFSSKDFKDNLTEDNVIGVYLPYMIVDINSHVNLRGQGEHLIKSYTDSNDNTYYSADVYDVGREFDLLVDDLTIETNSQVTNYYRDDKTNNIINSMMPFDTENCVEWNANYLKGYNSEKRDLNIDQLKIKVDKQTKDIAKYAASSSLTYYDRGVRWDREELEVKGRGWKTAYLPNWLYNYQQKDKKGRVIKEHYLAVNGRTKETKGSVPLDRKKLYLLTLLIALLIILIPTFMFGGGAFGMVAMAGLTIPLLLPLILFIILLIYKTELKYSNKKERHYHEKETNFTTSTIKSYDKLVRRQNGLYSNRIEGENSYRLDEGVIKTKTVRRSHSYTFIVFFIFIIIIANVAALPLFLLKNTSSTNTTRRNRTYNEYNYQYENVNNNSYDTENINKTY